MLAAAFGIPYVQTNMIPMGWASRTARDLFIPKKYRYAESKRFLSFREIIGMGADRWLYTQQYIASGIEVIENTSADILALAKEMNERQDGVWVPQDDDEELQERYRVLFPPDHPITGYPSRVGSEFLHQNRELLD